MSVLLVPRKPQQTLAATKLALTIMHAAGDQEEYHDVVPGTQAGRPGEQLLAANESCYSRPQLASRTQPGHISFLNLQTCLQVIFGTSCGTYFRRQLTDEWLH